MNEGAVKRSWLIACAPEMSPIISTNFMGLLKGSRARLSEAHAELSVGSQFGRVKSATLSPPWLPFLVLRGFPQGTYIQALCMFCSDPLTHQEGLGQVKQQTCPLSSQEVSAWSRSWGDFPGILQCLSLPFLQGAFGIPGWTFAERQEWRLLWGAALWSLSL